MQRTAEPNNKNVKDRQQDEKPIQTSTERLSSWLRRGKNLPRLLLGTTIASYSGEAGAYLFASKYTAVLQETQNPNISAGSVVYDQNGFSAVLEQAGPVTVNGTTENGVVLNVACNGTSSQVAIGQGHTYAPTCNGTTYSIVVNSVDIQHQTATFTINGALQTIPGLQLIAAPTYPGAEALVLVLGLAGFISLVGWVGVVLHRGLQDKVTKKLKAGVPLSKAIGGSVTKRQEYLENLRPDKRGKVLELMANQAKIKARRKETFMELEMLARSGRVFNVQVLAQIEKLAMTADPKTAKSAVQSLTSLHEAAPNLRPYIPEMLEKIARASLNATQIAAEALDSLKTEDAKRKEAQEARTSSNT